MRKLGLLAAVLFGAVSFAGIALDQTVTKTFTDCSASGSVAQTVTGGEYLLTVTTEDVWLCLADSASTCASGGTKFPPGFGMVITIGAGGQSASCRSTNATGDIQFTRKGN